MTFLAVSFTVALVVACILTHLCGVRRRKRSAPRPKQANAQALAFSWYHKTPSGKIVGMLKPREDVGSSNSC